MKEVLDVSATTVSWWVLSQVPVTYPLAFGCCSQQRVILTRTIPETLSIYVTTVCGQGLPTLALLVQGSVYVAEANAFVHAFLPT